MDKIGKKRRTQPAGRKLPRNGHFPVSNIDPILDFNLGLAI